MSDETPKEGIRYPEWKYYPVGWKALLQRRLEAEGRWGSANNQRKSYLKKNKCERDESWKWMCDKFPPIEIESALLESLQKEALRAEIASKRQGQIEKAAEMRSYRAGTAWVPELDNQAGREDAVEQRTISKEDRVNKDVIPVEDEVRWVMQHLNERGITMKDAPSPCAYQMWLFAVENPQEMMKFYLDMAKKAQSTESKDWVRDDEELDEFLGELRAQVPGNATAQPVGVGSS